MPGADREPQNPLSITGDEFSSSLDSLFEDLEVPARMLALDHLPSRRSALSADEKLSAFDLKKHTEVVLECLQTMVTGATERPDDPESITRCTIEGPSQGAFGDEPDGGVYRICKFEVHQGEKGRNSQSVLPPYELLSATDYKPDSLSNRAVDRVKAIRNAQLEMSERTLASTLELSNSDAVVVFENRNFSVSDAGPPFRAYVIFSKGAFRDALSHLNDSYNRAKSPLADWPVDLMTLKKNCSTSYLAGMVVDHVESFVKARYMGSPDATLQFASPGSDRAGFTLEIADDKYDLTLTLRSGVAEVGISLQIDQTQI